MDINEIITRIEEGQHDWQVILHLLKVAQTIEKQTVTSNRALVLEYHYKNGDCGAHPGTGEAEQALFDGFSFSRRLDAGPSHIVIREDTDSGQELSNKLLEAAAKPNTDFHVLCAIARLDRLALQAIADMKIESTTDYKGLLTLCIAVARIQIKKEGRV